jgi:SPP1 family predicted phage head-tail adaptor
MRSGALNKVVSLYKKTTERNTYGELVETWEEQKTFKAYVYMKSGKQTMAHDEVFDLVKIKLQVRNQHDICELDRINYCDKLYQVTFIQPDYTGRWLLIDCERLND